MAARIPRPLPAVPAPRAPRLRPRSRPAALGSRPRRRPGRHPLPLAHPAREAGPGPDRVGGVHGGAATQVLRADRRGTRRRRRSRLRMARVPHRDGPPHRTRPAHRRGGLMTGAEWHRACARQLVELGVSPEEADRLAEDSGAEARAAGMHPAELFGPATAYAASLAKAARPRPVADPLARSRGPVVLRLSGVTKRYRRRRVL